jgi:hypothetical protein
MTGSDPPAATQDLQHEGDTICPSKDETLRAQIAKIKAALEASSNGEDTSVVDKPLFEVIRECA